MNANFLRASCITALAAISASAVAQGQGSGCDGLPSHSQLKSALTAARQQANGGFDLDMWAAVVNRDGFVCAVAFTGDDRGSRIGGVNVFGGGLALYDRNQTLIGAIGVSGDTSCADHNIVWRTRHTLNLDFVPGGISAASDDNINYIGLVQVPSLANDFSHPVCEIAGKDNVSEISARLPPVQKPET